MLLCFSLVNELLLYMYLSQPMSTFTKLSKSALSSRWFLHPESQGTSDPTITHVFTYTLVGHSRIHRGDQIPVIFCPFMSLPSNMDLSNCESTFLFYILVRMSVCLSCFDLDFNILPVVSYFDSFVGHFSSLSSFLSQTSFSWCF